MTHKNQKIRQNFNLYFFFCVCMAYFGLCYYLKDLLSGLNLVVHNQVFELVFMKNTGAAFSIFRGSNLLLGVFAFVVFCGVLFFVLKNYKKLCLFEINGFAFLLSGVASNMLERFVDGYVTDYISLEFVKFPVFNLADVFINVGAVMILASLLPKKDEVKNG